MAKQKFSTGLGLIFVFLGCNTATAQIGVGFRTGVTWANMTFPDVDDDQYGDLNWETTSRVAPTMAIMIDLPIHGRFSLLTELAYQQRGYEHEWPAFPFGYGYAERLVLDYVDLNALAKFRVGRQPVHPHFLLGPVLGRMIGARQLYADKEGSFGNANGVVFAPDELDMERWNIGICGGAGFTISLGRSSLIAEGRYQYGMSNIWNGILITDLNGYPIGELNAFDRSWSFCIGWGFRLARPEPPAGLAPSPPSVE